MSGKEEAPPITPALLLEAYGAGYFPMAMSQKGRKLYWFSPEIRAVLKPEEMHISRTLKKQLRSHPYTLTVNAAFGAVITACANARSEKRDDTWINKEIISLYTQLHEMGFAHSVEVWEIKNEENGRQESPGAISPQNGAPCERQHIAQQAQLIGGLYGISLGGAFFGESMFSRRTGASKIALAHLVARLKTAGYSLLDAQFENPHLVQFGFQSIPAAEYQTLLRQALNASPNPSSRFLTISVNRS